MTCAITAGGAVQCWGSNDQQPEILQPTGLAGAWLETISSAKTGRTLVSSGWGSACALMTDGGVQCWDYDGSGELGSGADASTSLAPVPITGLAGSATAVTVGGAFACALTAQGSVQRWFRDYPTPMSSRLRKDISR